MARPRADKLPKYVMYYPENGSYYYKNPTMKEKANLGQDRKRAEQLAQSLNTQYRIQQEQEAATLAASVDFGLPTFGDAFTEFTDKYILDYRLKDSTARLLHQRKERLIKELGDIQMPLIDTEILREVIANSSQFEQSKLKTILMRFFKYAKSTGIHPSHLPNPVDNLYTDPVPPKQRQRMTLGQYRAIYAESPEWLRILMTLALHLALRRVDLVNLRFEDVVGDRIVSSIRKTDTQAREIEATSVDFPVHPDVRRAIAIARESSLKNGRCPFIVHRTPERQTRRAAEALEQKRMQHPAQVLPQYASKAFNKARDVAKQKSNVFEGLTIRELPSLHEVRALSSHLYSKAGYDVEKVKDLMAHTDPDMTRAYQKGHARKILRIDFMLPFSIHDDDDSRVRESTATYLISKAGKGYNRGPVVFLGGVFQEFSKRPTRHGLN